MNERQALDLWRHLICDYVRSDEADLTARQQAVLVTVALTSGPHTVRGLSADLNVAKPAITRALDVLESLGHVKRTKDPSDMRSVLIERTVQGADWLRAFGQRIIAAEAGFVEQTPTISSQRSVA
ncbi:MAG: MarR family winged helix-turn-helix transcriptional regulator [Pseudomonadota bacterium]